MPRLRRAAVLTLVAFGSSFAQAAAPGSPPWSAPAQAFLTRHCVDCHSGDSPDADLRLDAVSTTLADPRTLDLWVRLYDKVAKHQMPPADAPQPAQSERDAFARTLDEPLTAADLEYQRRHGRTVLRRLNRTEYENTVRDLLAHPQLELKDLLPADSESEGFDNVGAALTVSYVQQDAYLNAARRALERAVALYKQPPEKNFAFDFAQPPPDRPDRKYPPKPSHGLVLLSNTNLDPPVYMRAYGGFLFVASGDGWYDLTFRARGAHFDNRAHGGKAEGKLTPADRPHVILLYAERPPFSRHLATFDLPRDRMGELKIRTWLNAGEKIRRIHASIHEAGGTYRPTEIPFEGEVVGLEHFGAVGPQVAAWPPESHRRVLGDVPLAELPPKQLTRLPQPSGLPFISLVPAPTNPERDAVRLITDFVRRAFRRITPQATVDIYVKVAQDQLRAGAAFQDALFAAYQAALASPDFLYFQEQPGRLDGEALANRLAYFLWRSPPDEPLLAAGRSDKLHEPAELRSQVERLLDDPRSGRFVNDFTDQWLKLRELEFTMPDPDLYPEYHEDFELLDALPRETHAFFGEMVRRDLGVENVVDSDFAFLNRRLAALYGIDGVDGTEIRKVELPAGSVRGGILTQAAVLKVTANGTSTSPVVRGVWLMDRILGAPPPPPPAEVPAIEPDLSGAVTIRDQLAKHREVTTCAMCHKSIDPPGFALESFDIMGGFRTHYRALGVKPIPATFRQVKVKYGTGLPVECGGETAEGKKFADVREFKKVLLEDKPRLAKNLVERLVTFATGAPVRFGDRPDVEAIVKRLSAQNYGIRSMIHEVVASRMFRHK